MNLKKQYSESESESASKWKSPMLSPSECWIDDACILDMDFFVKTLSGIKSKGVCADLIGSIITHYASKWLPDLSSSSNDADSVPSLTTTLTHFHESPETLTVSWTKKRFFVETLIGVLPPEKTSVACNFLLRLLRTANMVAVDPARRTDLERRISSRLEEASLKDLMIPSFTHAFGTVLDVDLVTRLVKGFVVGSEATAGSGGAAMVKVAKLVDSYLAEAAMDVNLSLSQFVSLAETLPPHARTTHDGLYRAIDTYLKAHAELSKQEKKIVCRVIDSQKLTLEASLHASQNERLPVRAVIQVLFSDQSKLTRHHTFSKRHDHLIDDHHEMTIMMEMKKLKEEVARLESQCMAMQTQMENMVMEKKKKKLGLFRWKNVKLGTTTMMPAGVAGLSKSVAAASTTVVGDKNGEDGDGDGDDEEVGFGRQTPMDIMKTKLVKGRRNTTHRWRRSSIS